MKYSKYKIILSAHKLKANYSAVINGYPNVLMDIICKLYTDAFKKLTGEAPPPITDARLTYLFKTSYDIFATRVTVPNVVKSQITRAIDGEFNEVYIGHNIARFKYEKAKYNLQFLEHGLATHTLHIKNPHMELNPHMTVEFAIKHFNKNWDVRRFATNASLKWDDFERFLEEGCEFNTIIDDLFEPRIELAHGYLKNPNITVNEFHEIEKLILYDGFTPDYILQGLCANMFEWHPVIYQQRVNIARKTRKDIIASNVRNVLPNCVAATVLRYCDHS